MKVLFNLQVQQLYDLVRRKQVTPNRPASHYHVSCGHSFNNLWPMKSGGFGLVTGPEACEFLLPNVRRGNSYKWVYRRCRVPKHSTSISRLIDNR